MTTKRQAHRAAESDLQAFLSEAADRFKPDAAVLAARIDTAVQRYTATSTTQRFNAAAPLAIQQLQERILAGWRYDIGIPQSVYLAGTGNMSITLRKPESLVEQEITDLKRKVEESYHNELAAAMEREVDKLVQDAANEAQRLAEEAAAAERDAMRQRLRNMLLTGATV
ncbi:hypothetical protein AM387_10210 [Klebsiella pneumoniae]|uniref:hypothetical protein n=1 Tax=Klebsiella pneumoniae complex TaxID=3390273 RepID=UPI00081C5CD2|nr:MULTISPECIES: hypothetical protein [Klebsiella]EIV2088269.1 hypothetical protein [Klebsiella pneumoniae subsp. ozaenae]AOA97278.1 hypothetical protein A8C02_18645 [Klebsiella pneumoniae]AWC99055.1 hypothetical protein AM388_16230 [Klebsiella pneumoniae]AWD96771.1 hypothetical protein AM389_16515 [Klebsiella pneumoniae]AWS83947.1 hypothetical protein AM387_10210 [Klebsiella pneumoniae]